MRDHAWFEMRDIRKRWLSNAVWIPLRAYRENRTGKHSHIGFEEDVFSLGSVAFPIKHRQKAEALGWSAIGLGHEQRSFVLAAGYKPADVFQEPEGVDLGVDLLLDQGFDGAEKHEWHLHQDLVIALGLLREGDNWLCPQEGYVEVAHLIRDASRRPVLLEVRAEHLGDYLAARNMALRVATYRIRSAVLEDASHIPWHVEDLQETAGGDRFEARVCAIHCVLRTMSITDSGPCRSPIPEQADHLFRTMPNTDSGHVDHLLGG